MLKRCVMLAVVASLFALPAMAADTIPASYSDAEFWRLINEFSEPNAPYQYENFVSNEISFQTALPELKRQTKPGGVYLGVGPEQNFTYIAAIEPKVAFIIDIRRQNMIELLLYKALFEMSADRADFVERLFSRKRPAGLGPKSTAAEIILAFESLPADEKLFAETLAAVKDNLIRKHGFKPIGDDEQKIEYLFNVFYRGGPRMNYAFASSSPNQLVPSYKWLMLATDTRGENWAFLNAESRYQYVKDMQQKNLIVPLVGDFGGSKTLKTLGKYLKDHGAVVSVFYISNVEDYIESKWSAYVANLQALPQDDRSMLLRFITMTVTQISWMRDTPSRWPAMFTSNAAPKLQ